MADNDAHLFALLDALDLGMYAFRLEDPPHAESLRIVFASRASEAILGIAPSAVVGGLIGEHFPNSLEESGPAGAYRDVVMNQAPRDLGVISYGDSRVREVRFAVSAYPFGPDTVIIVFENMSADPKKLTELAAIVESAQDAITSKDLDGTILTWNLSAERIYGYSAAEVVGRSIAMLLPPDRQDEVTEIIRRIRADDRVEHLITRRVRKDGVVIDVSLTLSPIRDRRGTVVGVATIGRDIGDQNHAQDRAQQLAAIVDASADAIFSRRLDGTVTSWNAGAERLLGYTAAEFIGKSIHVLNDPVPEILEMRERLTRGEYMSSFETRLRRKDGTHVLVSISAAPVRNDSGEVVGVAGVIRDVTQQRRLEEQLRQAQKLEAIGSLAAGVAHDFNNILTVIRTTSETILRGNPDHTLRERVARIDLAAEHASSLTHQLLAFSRQQVLRPEATNLNNVVDTTLELAGRLIGEHVQIRSDLASNLLPIHVDRGQLQQVILNLSVNARDAMLGGGTLHLRTSNVLLDAGYASEHPDVTAGPHVLIELTDTGSGMDAETRDRIFDPFFTTKNEGTGLGLATVYGIVRQSGGHIWVYSEPGLGTTFKLYFPAAEGQVRATEVDHNEVKSLVGDETILLVEDAAMLRPVVAEMLEEHGYTVLAAADGVDALTISDQCAGQIDLLLTDVVMPRMSGRELADHMRTKRPEMRVLFTSGFPADTIVRHGISEDAVVFIQKPYIGDTLLTKIRKTLAAEGPRS